jgi:hypothetical protein
MLVPVKDPNALPAEGRNSKLRRINEWHGKLPQELKGVKKRISNPELRI